MKQIMIELEESNLRWAKSWRRQALSQLKWSCWECLIFGAVGLWFCLSPLTGASIWYILTGLVYAGLVFFLFRFVRPHWIRQVWQANRRIAEARIRLRRLNEE